MAVISARKKKSSRRLIPPAGAKRAAANPFPKTTKTTTSATAPTIAATASAGAASAGRPPVWPDRPSASHAPPGSAGVMATFCRGREPQHRHDHPARRVCRVKANAVVAGAVRARWAIIAHHQATRPATHKATATPPAMSIRAHAVAVAAKKHRSAQAQVSLPQQAICKGRAR